MDDDVDTHTHDDGSNRAAKFKWHGARYPVCIVFMCMYVLKLRMVNQFQCSFPKGNTRKNRGNVFMWKHFNIDFNFNIYPPQIQDKIIGSFCFQNQRRRKKNRKLIIKLRCLGQKLFDSRSHFDCFFQWLEFFFREPFLTDFFNKIKKSIHFNYYGDWNISNEW